MIANHINRLIKWIVVVAFGSALHPAAADVVSIQSRFVVDVEQYNAVSLTFGDLLDDDPEFIQSNVDPDWAPDEEIRLLDSASSGLRLSGGPDSNLTYSEAMFNLAKYEGQTVSFVVAFNRAAARSSGTISLNNLSITVTPATVAATAHALTGDPDVVFL